MTSTTSAEPVEQGLCKLLSCAPIRRFLWKGENKSALLSAVVQEIGADAANEISRRIDTALIGCELKGIVDLLRSSSLDLEKAMEISDSLNYMEQSEDLSSLLKRVIVHCGHAHLLEAEDKNEAYKEASAIIMRTHSTEDALHVAQRRFNAVLELLQSVQAPFDGNSNSSSTDAPLINTEESVRDIIDELEQFGESKDGNNEDPIRFNQNSEFAYDSVLVGFVALLSRIPIRQFLWNDGTRDELLNAASEEFSEAKPDTIRQFLDSSLIQSEFKNLAIVLRSSSLELAQVMAVSENLNCVEQTEAASALLRRVIVYCGHALLKVAEDKSHEYKIVSARIMENHSSDEPLLAARRRFDAVLELLKCVQASESNDSTNESVEDLISDLEHFGTDLSAEQHTRESDTAKNVDMIELQRNNAKRALSGSEDSGCKRPRIPSQQSANEVVEVDKLACSPIDTPQSTRRREESVARDTPMRTTRRRSARMLGKSVGIFQPVTPNNTPNNNEDDEDGDDDEDVEPARSASKQQENENDSEGRTSMPWVELRKSDEIRKGKESVKPGTPRQQAFEAYKLGDLVLAKYGEHPYWPAEVRKCHQRSHARKWKRPSDKTLWCDFINEDSGGWVHVDKIVLFDPIIARRWQVRRGTYYNEQRRAISRAIEVYNRRANRPQGRPNTPPPEPVIIDEEVLSEGDDS